MLNSNCRFYLVSRIFTVHCFTVYYDNMDLTVFLNFNYDFFFNEELFIYLFCRAGCSLLVSFLSLGQVEATF